jgi:glycine betaine/proline transport system ATP-binding protein
VAKTGNSANRPLITIHLLLNQSLSEKSLRDFLFLKQESGRGQICQQADVWIEKSDNKWNVSSSPKLKLIEWNEQTKFEELTSDSLVVASPDIEMRDAFEIRYHTGNPIVLIENGELVGTLSDHDFYHALLGKYQQEQAA